MLCDSEMIGTVWHDGNGNLFQTKTIDTKDSNLWSSMNLNLLCGGFESIMSDLPVCLYDRFNSHTFVVISGELKDVHTLRVFGII